jgi:hypothetical protein
MRKILCWSKQTIYIYILTHIISSNIVSGTILLCMLVAWSVRVAQGRIGKGIFPRHSTDSWEANITTILPTDSDNIVTCSRILKHDVASTVTTQLNSLGLSVPHRKHITSPLRAQQVNATYRFVTMVYWYNYHNSGHYPSSCLLFKTRRFGHCTRPPSSDGAYSVVPSR